MVLLLINSSFINNASSISLYNHNLIHDDENGQEDITKPAEPENTNFSDNEMEEFAQTLHK